MDDRLDARQETVVDQGRPPEYVTPRIRVLSEADILSAFQVTAAGTTSWWNM